MINRELQSITVLSFTDTLDEYGQKRQSTPTTRTVEAVIKPYANLIVDNPIFNDVTLIALTKDDSISDSNRVTIGTNNYSVAYVIKSNRYNQVFLKVFK